MMNSRSIGRMAGAGLLFAGMWLAGCNSEYVVLVHNDAARAVQVRLMQDQVASDPVMLTGARVYPGGEARLGPVKAAVTDDVVLEVEEVGEIGVPAGKMRLSPGESEFRVGASGSGSWGPVPISPVGK